MPVSSMVIVVAVPALVVGRPEPSLDSPIHPCLPEARSASLDPSAGSRMQIAEKDLCFQSPALAAHLEATSEEEARSKV